MKCAVFLLTLALAATTVCAIPPRQVADEDVDRAIGEAQRYIYAAQQADGNWRSSQIPQGGDTAMALFALLESGESIGSDKIKSGLDSLVKLETDNTYVIAMRTMVLSKVAHNNPELIAALKKDVAWLQKGLPQAGAWGYKGPEANGDNSCSQFGLMALWESQRAGIELNDTTVRAIESAWKRRQKPDGGWTYAGQASTKADSTATMTSAGIASLYLCEDVLDTNCTPYQNARPMDQAWKWFKDNLKEDYYKNGYLAFCVQRIGMTSGNKFIGNLDWFAQGAASFCAPNPGGRQYNSEWGGVVEASFELTFLSRGRLPLTFNKLQYGTGDSWNTHTRDVARLTEFVYREFESRMRWQTVSIDDDIEMMQDAPILFVAGAESPALSDAQWDKLRQYSLRGGTLLFMPTHQSTTFLKTVKDKLAVLYKPDHDLVGGHYTFEQLPADHPIYSIVGKVSNAAVAAPMWGVSDGSRLVAIICEKDLAHAWQRRATTTARGDFELGASLYLYATGYETPRTHMRPVFKLGAGAARSHAKVAWLKYSGNWNTQPYALKVLSDKLTAEARVDLDTKVGVPIEESALAGNDLVWMTGTDAFTLTDPQVAALRAYLDQGGTLFVNAVGGASAFDDPAQKMLDKLFTGRKVEIGSAPPNSPIMTGKADSLRGPPIQTLEGTRQLKRQAARQASILLYTEGGRAMVIYSKFGIHDTLDGHVGFNSLSFLPTSARDLACNIVLYSMMAKPKTATTDPAGASPSVPATP